VVYYFIEGNMFEKENEFYERNKDTLRKQYSGKRIVIIEDKVIGVYNSNGEAYKETVKTRRPGTFVIKYLPVNPADEVRRLSPVSFTHG
jgi:hypothetical protein